jgi:hypothetical protein
MRLFESAAALVLISSLGSTAYAMSGSSSCNESHLQTYGDLDTALSIKAVEIVRLSALPDSKRALEKLIDANATFSLGGGDVGRPLGAYLAGARAISQLMGADTYRFNVWSSIPTPIQDPCSSHTVEVEFINTAHSSSYPVKFTFNAGALVKAEGWATSFRTGILRPRAEGGSTSVAAK